MLNAWTRIPWPALASGGVLIVLGLAVNVSTPLTSLSASEEIFVSATLLTGFFLVSVSLALMDARDGHDAVRRWRAGLRSVVAFAALWYAAGHLNHGIYRIVNPILGSPGSPFRIVFAVVTIPIVFYLPFKLAPPLAEVLRRAAAWLGEGLPR